MVDDKVLIFNNYDLKLTDGGPSGFLAHNLAGVKSDYFLLSDNTLKESFISKIQRKAIQFGIKYPLYKKLMLEKNNELENSVLYTLKTINTTKLNPYKYVFFHDVYSLFLCSPFLSKHHVIILQSHCPELPSQEIKNLLPHSKSTVTWVEKVEKKAFEIANTLIFPNEYAALIYQPLIKNTHKVYYLLSGVSKPKTYSKIPLDDNSINFIYIGRRNKIKGFDIVIDAFKKALKFRSDINLFILGNGDEISSPNIYDLGYTSRPLSWMASCDYLINCNRQSYFDMSILEALSVGTPIIMTKTHGHKIFSKFQSPGLINIGTPNVNNLANILVNNDLKKRKDNGLASILNSKLFHQNFSNETYVKRFENLIAGKIISKKQTDRV